MIRVVDYIVSYLYKIHTEHVFMLTGGGAMYLNDAVAAHKKIKPICHHHEQACVMAAESYSRITGNLGTAIISSGPAGTNAVTGVLGAWQDSTPCLIISGQVKKEQTIFNSKIAGLRQMGTQEANIIPIIQSITKFSAVINEPKLIRYYLEKATYIAKEGRPGPVWLDIPHDVQAALIDTKNLTGFNPSELGNNKVKPTDEEIDTVIKLLKSSKKPVIIAGNGIRLSGAIDEFLQLINKIKIPVVTTFMGIDVLSDNHPFYIGTGGTKGQRTANIAIQNADLVISIGSRLSITFIGHTFKQFAYQAKKIVIDIDRTEHQKKTIKIDLLIIADAKQFIKKMILKTENKKFNFKKSWVQKCKELKHNYPVCLSEYAKLTKKMNMYYVVNQISEALKKNDIIVSDAGSAFYVVSQTFKIKQGQRLILPGGTATMGFNLPASIGASVGSSNSRIICITGDGSLQMNIHELATIAYHHLPIKIFVLNNEGYLSIRNTQNNFFNGRYIGESTKTGVSFPHLDKIAKSYDIKFFRANNNEELAKIIPLVLNYKGPVICETMCLEKQAIIPTVSSKQQPNGTIVSVPIDDMYPFLPKEEMENIKSNLN